MTGIFHASGAKQKSLQKVLESSFFSQGSTPGHSCDPWATPVTLGRRPGGAQRHVFVNFGSFEGVENDLAR